MFRLAEYHEHFSSNCVLSCDHIVGPAEIKPKPAGPYLDYHLHQVSISTIAAYAYLWAKK